MPGTITRLVVLAGLAQAATAQTQIPDVSEVELRAQELRPGIHAVLGGGGNVGVSVGEDGIFIIDDNLEPLAPRLIEAIGRIAEGPIRFVINTHWHYDHVGGNELLGERGALLVAHENVRMRMSTPQFMKAFGNTVPASPPAALPVVTFSESMTLHLNGEAVRIYHVANAHTDGDGIVHFSGADVVHMGDVFFNSSYPFIDTSSGGTSAGLIAAAERVLAAADDDTVIIPGHGPVTDRSGLASYRDLLVDVRDRVMKLVASGATREAAIAARPTAPYDARWGQGFMKADRFVGILYDDLTAR